MRLPPRQVSAAGDTSVSSSSSGTAGDVASSHLSWWQLLCVTLGGVLSVTVGAWAWWHHRKKGKEDKERAKEAVAEEKKRIREVLERKKKEEESGSEEWSEESKNHDSVSDGGTIRPRRRQRRQAGRGTGRRRDSDSESESSDASSITYDQRKRGRGVSRRPREAERRRENAWRRGESRRREDDYRYKRDRRHRRRSLSPSPSPSPSPTPGPIPNPRRRKRDTFRDSVFSSYGSMKKAAVRLKYVEAKVKLKQQLADEEAVERARQEKIRQANREIFQDRLRGEKEEDSAGSSHGLLIPPAHRPATRSSSGSSSGSNKQLPIPPERARPNPLRQGSADSQRPVPPQQASSGAQRQLPTHQGIGQPQRQLSRQDSSPCHPLRQNSNELGDEISHLLRGPSRPVPADRRPSSSSKVENDFQADWLSHPNPAVGVPLSARTDSVYVPVTRPNERPTIPKGGLAPAPPPKIKAAPMVASPAAGGTGANKWADRLRGRR